MRGADLLIKTLAKAGVTRIFALSGNQIMPVFDACFEAGIEIIHTRHEAAAVYMAEAHAQLSGGIGVCLVTAGPGATGGAGALFAARMSESPVLYLTGDSPRAQDGTGAFQELDQVAVSAPMTKLSFRAQSAAGLGEDMARAVRTALAGRPGPVHVALPFDVVEGDASGTDLPPLGALEPEVADLPEQDARAVAAALAASEHPLILCGPALNETRMGAVTASLADAVDAPVIAMENPRGLNGPSMGGFMHVFAQADLIVCLGKAVNFTLGFGAPAPNARWIVVDPEPAEHSRAERNLGASLASVLKADPKAAALAITAKGQGVARRSAWRAEVAGKLAERSYCVDAPAPGDKITPAVLVAAVQRRIEAAAETVAICDGGEVGQWFQAGIAATHQIINGLSGAIGGCLCYGVAAKKARPEATVFAMMGDGTVGFHLAEFETALRVGAPFVVVIGNDQRWNAEHLIQQRAYGPDRMIGLELSGARYDLAVEGLGGHGEYVTDPGDLDAALSRAVASGKVACVNVIIAGAPGPAGGVH